MNAAEFLKLNPKLVRAHAEAYYGFALAPREKPNTELPLQARTDYLTIAASYFAVVDPERAKKCFQEAAASALIFAMEKRREDEAASFVSNEWFGRAASLTVCGNGNLERIFPRVNFELHGAIQTPNYVATELIMRANELLKARQPTVTVEYLDHLRQMAAKFEGHTVGKMRIPIGLFVRFADFVLDRTPIQALGSWLKEIGDRIEQRVRLAQSSEYLWANLHSSLLPFDPEVLSVMVTYMHFTKHRPESFQEHPPALRAYLEVAMEINRVE